MSEYKPSKDAIRRVKIKQMGGDDGYQWCVIIDGRVKWDGMTRQEAAWRQENERRTLDGVK